MSSPDIFFVPGVQSVFTDYFTTLGAEKTSVIHNDSIEYQADDWFARLSYEPFSGPRYPLYAHVGPLPKRSPDLAHDGCCVRHFVPSNVGLHNYSLDLRYTNLDQLSVALARLRDNLFKVFLEPVFFDLPRLRAVVENVSQGLLQQQRDEIDEHNASVSRTKAEAAFQQKDFTTAIEHYKRIPLRRLRDIDTAKLIYAEKQV